jgi:lactam utilization protein B
MFNPSVVTIVGLLVRVNRPDWGTMNPIGARHGSLASRKKPGSVIHDPAIVVARAVRMVKERNVVAIDGSLVPLEADTICVHGDTPGSDDLAAKIRAGLEAAGITVRAIGLP